MNLKPETLQRIDEVIPRYPEKRSAVMPILHFIQAEQGMISNDAIEWVAARLEIQPINVLEVVTFFPYYRQTKLGRTHVRVCRTLSCALRGAYRVGEALEKELGCKLGTTKADGSVTLEYAECLAACGTGPVVLVDEDLYENLSAAKLSSLVDEIKKRAAGVPSAS
ncbi:MAG: NADH-quinone oxidoreductase subunit NuoE [Opitutales bacterium]